MWDTYRSALNVHHYQSGFDESRPLYMAEFTRGFNFSLSGNSETESSLYYDRLFDAVCEAAIIFQSNRVKFEKEFEQ